MKSLNAKTHIENRKIKILPGEIYRSQIFEIRFILKSGMKVEVGRSGYI